MLLLRFLPALFIILGVAFLLLLLYWSHQRWVQLKQEKISLAITLPRGNEATPFASEQLFASLHGIMKPWYRILAGGQEHLSFEVLSSEGTISFHVVLPAHLKDLVEKQIYAQYPDAEIEEADTFRFNAGIRHLSLAELELVRSDSFPIKTFKDFVNSDPLAGLTNSLTKLGGNVAMIQLLVKPAGQRWRRRGYQLAMAVRTRRQGKALSFMSGVVTLLMNITLGFLSLIPFGHFGGATSNPNPALSVEHTETEKMILDAVEGKTAKLGFYFKLRIALQASEKGKSKLLLRNIVASFKQYNIAGLNGFKRRLIFSRKLFVKRLNSRFFPVFNLGCGVLNIEELSSLWHMPNKDIGTPGIKWGGAKKAPVPSQIGEEGIVLVKSRFRGEERKVRIKSYDEAAHIWVVGKTRTGKTTCIKGQALQHIERGDGVILIDLHGDLYEEIVGLMPKKRKNDLYLVDLSDTEYPVGFNMLELKRNRAAEKVLVVDELIGVFKKIFAESWGPSTDDIFRMSAYAVVDYGEGTILDMLQMIGSDTFRSKVKPYIKSHVVKDYWATTFRGLDVRTKSSILNPPLNKLRRFLGNQSILNIVAQPKSTFDIRKIMDEGKIMLVNLAKGTVGEENAILLGSMLVSKIQLEAMSRVDLSPAKRKQCFIYLDEFQNFVTEGIATLLSESAKYGVTLILANQYPSQLREDIRRSVLGNVGTLIIFQLGAEEAENIAKEFLPTVSANDIVNLDRFNCYVKLRVDAKATKSFSGVTIPWEKEADPGWAREMKEASRQEIGRPRKEVESEIAERLGKESNLEEKRQKASEIAERLQVSLGEAYELLKHYKENEIEKAVRVVRRKMETEKITDPGRYVEGVIKRWRERSQR